MGAVAVSITVLIIAVISLVYFHYADKKELEKSQQSDN